MSNKWKKQDYTADFIYFMLILSAIPGLLIIAADLYEYFTKH